MRDSKIEWTDHTFNPWWGCTKVSDACDNCYAEAWAKRTGHSVWGHSAPRRPLSDHYWKQPLLWDQEAAHSGRKRVFCASMADVFEWRSDLKQHRKRLWTLIGNTPNLDWLLLTKRPHLAERLTPWGNNWPSNVWLGTTVENQLAATKRIPKLLDSNAKVKFLSCEPLLEGLDLQPWITGLSWVITGGETGSKARPTSPAWFRDIRDICVEHDVPFHFKQWGDWFPVQEMGDYFVSTRVETWYGEEFVKIGKKKTGRCLDQLMWNQLPVI